MTVEELVKCPMIGLEGITGDDDTVSVSGDGIVRALKENMKSCPFLAMAQGIRVYVHC